MLDKLPLEIINIFMLMIDPIDIVSMFKTCRKFNLFSRDETFWKSLWEIYFPKKALTGYDKAIGHKNFFQDKYKPKIYEALISVSETVPYNCKDQPVKLFHEIVKIFNANIKKTNPGLHILITKKKKDSHFYKSNAPIGDRLSEVLELRLPISFKLWHDSQKSRPKYPVFNPAEEISVHNIVSCKINSQKAKLQNPLLKNKLITLDEIKKPLKLLREEIRRRNSPPKSFDYPHWMSKTPLTDILLYTKLGSAINSDTKEDILWNVHKIHQEASNKGNYNINFFSGFFKEIGFTEYNPSDSDEEFLNKAYNNCFISKTALEWLIRPAAVTCGKI